MNCLVPGTCNYALVIMLAIMTMVLILRYQALVFLGGAGRIWRKGEFDMPRPLRSEVFRPQEIAILHCVQRCVRRAYLSGVDSVTGTDYSYRKEWIRQRIEKLASVFGTDVLAYAILSNHLHVILRSRPDVVATWSDRQVALRWLQIFPGKRIEEQLGDPTTADVESLANNPERMAVIRLRLSDISWFMKALSEPIARFANKE